MGLRAKVEDLSKVEPFKQSKKIKLLKLYSFSLHHCCYIIIITGSPRPMAECLPDLRASVSQTYGNISTSTKCIQPGKLSF